MAGQMTANAFKFGTYSSDAGYANLVGQIGYFKDADNVAGVVTVNSQRSRRCVLVKNGSGTTIAAGSCLKFVAAKYGTQVQIATNGAAIRCFAPYTVSGSTATTIPDGAYFWAVVKGPTYAATDAAAIAEGDMVEVGVASGQIKTNATALAANKSVVGGTAMLAAAAKGTGAQVYAYIDANGDFQT
jgi:hypothetical protein